MNNFAHLLPAQKMKDVLVDGTRKNRFLVDFSALVRIFPDAAQELEDVRLLVTAAPLPGRTMSKNTVYHQGIPLEYAGMTEHPADWTITVLNDVNNKSKKIFESWMSLEHNWDTNTLALASSYKEKNEVNVDQLDGKGNVIARKVLHNMWLVSMSDIDGDSSSGEFQTYQLTFSYDYWTSIYGNSDPLLQTATIAPNSIV